MTLQESKILNGDSLEIIPSLPDKSFDLLIADPPYDISRPSNVQSMGRAGLDFGDWDKGFDQFTWIDLVLPKLKPGAHIVIWNDWEKLGSIASFIRNRLNLPEDKHAFRPIVWHKTNPNPLNCRSLFVQSMEFAVWTKVPGAKSTFNSKYNHGIFWINHSINKSADHPTKKPEGVFKEIINLLTNNGDWVLDPFLGGGTTAHACEELGRKFIGIEKDKIHYQTAKAHWEKARV